MKKKLMLLGIFIALPFMISVIVISNTPGKTNNVEVTEEIKLYSNGKLVGEWTGIGQGQMEGNSYTFTTSRGAFREDVRIQGDFVIERSSN